MTIGKLGVQWDFSERFIFRAGYSRANQIIPDVQALFNIRYC